MSLIFSPAFVLRSFRHRETSMILHLFSRESGKVHCIAKGIRRSGRSGISSLHTGSCVNAVFYKRGKPDGLKILKEITPAVYFPRIQCDLIKTGIIHSAFEVLSSILDPGWSSPELFTITEDFMRRIESGADCREVFFIFNSYLLDISALFGFMLDTASEAPVPPPDGFEPERALEYSTYLVSRLFNHFEKRPALKSLSFLSEALPDA
ncbi:MAG: DNA repair protein RecO [Fibrobacterota bacterium]